MNGSHIGRRRRGALVLPGSFTAAARHADDDRERHQLGDGDAEVAARGVQPER